MNKRTLSFSATGVLKIVLIFGSACGGFSDSAVSENTAKSNKPIVEVKTRNADAPKRKSAKTEKADFEMTAEKYVKEFAGENVTAKDLEKYVDKQIIVTGRAKMFSFEEHGTAPPYIVLEAPEPTRGIVCYLGNNLLDDRAQVQTNKIVTVRGILDAEQFVRGVPPPLASCAVLKTD